MKGKLLLKDRKKLNTGIKKKSAKKHISIKVQGLPHKKAQCWLLLIQI